MQQLLIRILCIIVSMSMLKAEMGNFKSTRLLPPAILRRINAEGVNFINANLNMVEAQKANFRHAI